MRQESRIFITVRNFSLRRYRHLYASDANQTLPVTQARLFTTKTATVDLSTGAQEAQTTEPVLMALWIFACFMMPQDAPLSM